MIRLHLIDGSHVDTSLHTEAQAIAAHEAGVGLLVGGPHDGDTEKRTIRPEQIEKVEELPW